MLTFFTEAYQALLAGLTLYQLSLRYQATLEYSPGLAPRRGPGNNQVFRGNQWSGNL
jgi:hypothetical protein